MAIAFFISRRDTKHTGLAIQT